MSRIEDALFDAHQRIGALEGLCAKYDYERMSLRHRNIELSKELLALKRKLREARRNAKRPKS